MELATNIALPLVLGVLAGQWLDHRLGTKALFTVVLLFLALGVGFYNFYRVLTRELKWK
jgi:F0F1-type ATP synthase assembly protein I